MDEKQLQALANELAKNLKIPEDLSQFDRLLKKLSVEAALNTEMTHQSDLSGSHGRGRPAGTGSVRCGLGQSLSSDKPKLAG
ncbi:hypothetical protein [Escherichia coli]|uniref:hypothetical protein n=1 Tax=Escherichia coli TaxID=562 RepID=UPI001F0DAA89|nr:hypothetical protein [Escherichia coli]